MLLRIRKAKGSKDRYSILSNVALEVLKEYWREYRPKECLFPGRSPYNPLSARSIQRIFQKAKHLGRQIGFISILHTWGQNLMDHLHIHCIVTGGGLSLDGTRWISCRKGFFLPVKVLSRLFRAKALYYLKESWKSEELKFPGNIASLQDPAHFAASLHDLYCREWVVYSKPPFKGPEMVLSYLGWRRR